MRATKAYIASLGTTGVLLAASILMLAVVGAVVAFDSWPGAEVSTPVKTLLLTNRPAPIRVGAHSLGPSATPTPRGAAPHAPGATTAPRFVAPKPTAGTRTAAPVGPVTPAVPAVPGLPKTPSLPPPDQLPNLISNPSTTATQIADAGQGVTDTAGVSVARLSPELGGAVAGAGQTAAATVRELPLPGHLIPGH